jgi:hypothetical protein
MHYDVHNHTPSIKDLKITSLSYWQYILRLSLCGYVYQYNHYSLACLNVVIVFFQYQNSRKIEFNVGSLYILHIALCWALYYQCFENICWFSFLVTFVDMVELMFAPILFVHNSFQKIMAPLFYSNYIKYEVSSSKISHLFCFYR